MTQLTHKRIGGLARLGSLFLAVVVAATGSSSAAEVPVAGAQALGIVTVSDAAPVTYVQISQTAMQITFARYGLPANGDAKATILIDSGVASSPLFGNYIDKAINKLQFGIAGSGMSPRTATVRLKNSVTKRSWYYNFTVQAQSGIRQSIDVPLKLASGWVTPTAGANKDAMFAQDLQNVDYLAVTLQPGTDSSGLLSPEQSYTIDGFVVVNDDGISSPPATLSALEKAFLARFGYGYGSADKLTAGMKAWDVDGDGMADYLEILFENDELFAKSNFVADIIEVTDAGVKIQWPSVSGETYTVLRTDIAGTQFAAVVQLSLLSATNTGYMSAVDKWASGSGPFYYRIVKH